MPMVTPPSSLLLHTFAFLPFSLIPFKELGILILYSSLDTKSLKSSGYFTFKAYLEFGPASFQVLGSHMWLVAAALDQTGRPRNSSGLIVVSSAPITAPGTQQVSTKNFGLMNEWINIRWSSLILQPSIHVSYMCHKKLAMNL